MHELPKSVAAHGQLLQSLNKVMSSCHCLKQMYTGCLAHHQGMRDFYFTHGQSVTFLCLQLMLPATQLISRNFAQEPAGAFTWTYTRDLDGPAYSPPSRRSMLGYRERLSLPQFWHEIAQKANLARSERKEKLACESVLASIRRDNTAQEHARAHEVYDTCSKLLQRADV